MTRRRRTRPSQVAYQAAQAELLERARPYLPRIRQLLAEDLADEDLCRALAAWVAAYRQREGIGPTWRELALQARPDLDEEVTPGRYEPGVRRLYARELCQALEAGGWLVLGRRRGSMAAGPAHLVPPRQAGR
ncbi:hypothetical protein [Nonomuraea sp. NPDC049646]|uniref:hypothetical protein n=1 Tax=unclassified Nonomuraea TaxID=2593643 RepID=UPI0037B7FBB2